MIFPLARLGVFCHFAGLDDFPFFVWGFGLVYLWPHLGQAPNFAWGELACLIFGHDAYRPLAFQCFGTFARLHDFPFCPAFRFCHFARRYDFHFAFGVLGWVFLGLTLGKQQFMLGVCCPA